MTFESTLLGTKIRVSLWRSATLWLIADITNYLAFCIELNWIGKSNHQMMQLFNRFVELYGSSLQEPPSIGGVELWPMNQSNPV